MSPDSPKKTPPRTRTHSTKSRTRTKSAGKDEANPASFHAEILSEQRCVNEAADNENSLDHVNVSNLSMASLPTSASTPLSTPKVLQEGFSTPTASSENYTFHLQDSPYLGIEAIRDSITITADDLIGAVPRIEHKSKIVAPLKIRKKPSSSKLAEPLSLASPREERQNKDPVDTPIGGIDQSRIPASSGQPTSPTSPKTPRTPRSPSAFFSAMFSRLPVSPSVMSASAAISQATEGERDAMQILSATDAPELSSKPLEDVTSPELSRRSKTLNKPPFEKVKKMFASSHDLVKHCEGKPSM